MKLFWHREVHASPRFSIPGCHLNSAAVASSRRFGQEDSCKAQKTIQLAGLYFLGFDTYHVGPRVSPLELQVTQQTLACGMPATVITVYTYTC